MNLILTMTLERLIKLRDQMRIEHADHRDWYGRPEDVPASIMEYQADRERMLNKEIAKVLVQIEQENPSPEF